VEKSLIKNFRHTGIIVSNMQKSQYFYENILGFKVVQNYTDDSAYINKLLGIIDGEIHMVKLKSVDGYTLELLEYLNHPTKLLEIPFYNVGICHLAFSVDNIDKIYQRLIKKKVKTISKPLLSSEGNAKVFFCIDPNGIRIELVQVLKC